MEKLNKTEGGHHRRPKLMTKAFIQPNQAGPLPVEIARGMVARTRENHELGLAAAVVVDPHGGQATHFLLIGSFRSPTYRLVPVRFICRVRQGVIQLDLGSRSVDSFPHYE
jgi:hypothetical protein